MITLESIYSVLNKSMNIANTFNCDDPNKVFVSIKALKAPFFDTLVDDFEIIYYPQTNTATVTGDESSPLYQTALKAVTQ
jgi:hypothetical protein